MGECSAECGVGTRTNTRVKLVEEANGGTCDGQPTEIEECQAGECPSKLLIFILQSERQYIELPVYIDIQTSYVLKFIL